MRVLLLLTLERESRVVGGKQGVCKKGFFLVSCIRALDQVQILFF